MTILNLKESLSDKCRQYYIDQQEIDSMHPLEGGSDHIFCAALCLIKERHDRYDLVNLVNYLLHKIHTDGSLIGKTIRHKHPIYTDQIETGKIVGVSIHGFNVMDGKYITRMVSFSEVKEIILRDNTNRLTAGDSLQFCQPNYEHQIKSLTDDLQKTSNLKTALIYCVGIGHTNGRIIEIIGELITEEEQLNQRIEELIQKQEKES